MESNRDYISYSQYALFKSSQKAYYEKYGLDKKVGGTKYQNFGKKLMEDLEFGELEGVPQDLKDLVEACDIELEITTRGKGMEKDLFGIVDAISRDKSVFFEIKTGIHTWSRVKVMKDEQMLFYALMIYLKYGVLPYAWLVYVETIELDGEIKFTGEVVATKREFSLTELLSFEATLDNVINEISDYEHTVYDIAPSIDARLLKALSDKKRADAELEVLKAELLIELNEFDNKYGVSENFNVTLAKRKNYVYSSELKKDMADSAVKFKLQKSEEEKSGVATIKTTEYLLIKPKK